MKEGTHWIVTDDDKRSFVTHVQIVTGKEPKDLDAQYEAAKIAFKKHVLGLAQSVFEAIGNTSPAQCGAAHFSETDLYHQFYRAAADLLGK